MEEDRDWNISSYRILCFKTRADWDESKLLTSKFKEGKKTPMISRRKTVTRRGFFQRKECKKKE